MLSQLQETDTSPILPIHKSREVYTARSFAYNARRGVEPSSIAASRDRVRTYPFDWISLVQTRRIARIPLGTSSVEPPWVSEVFHKYVAFVAILVRLFKDPQFDSELYRLMQDSALRLSLDLSTLGCTIAPEAFELIPLMITALLNSCDLTVSSGMAEENGSKTG